MAVYAGNKVARLTQVVVDKGLNGVDITDADVRTGKISINNRGEKIIGASTLRRLQSLTNDATATANDIDSGYSGYSNGVKIDGAYMEITVENSINGNTITKTAGGTISIGDFVKLSGSNVVKVTSASDIIYGVAQTSGTSGSTITVKIPY